MLRRCSEHLPSATAVVLCGERFTYGALLAAADALASRLAATAQQQRGSEHGPRIGIYAEPGPQYVAATWAAWQAGGIAVRCRPVLPMPVTQQRRNVHILNG